MKKGERSRERLGRAVIREFSPFAEVNNSLLFEPAKFAGAIGHRLKGWSSQLWTGCETFFFREHLMTKAISHRALSLRFCLLIAFMFGTGSLSPTAGADESVAPPAPGAPAEVEPVAGTAEGDADNPIIVTASRSAQPAFKSPFTIEYVGEQELHDRAYRSLSEALAYTPGVMVQRTGPGQSSPFMRGFTGFRTLFLIDGIRLNNSVFRDGPNQYWSTVDIHSVGHLELVKGPSSVLYGSDAIGGTLNAITKSPHTYGTGVNVESSVYYRVSSAEKSHTIHAETSLTVDETFGFHFGATGQWFGDTRGGHGTGKMDDTGYDEWDADFKGEYFFNPDTRLVFAYQRVQQNNVPRWHSTTFSKSFEGTALGTDVQRDLDQNRELFYIQLHAENVQDMFFDKLSTGISWHEQDEVEHRIVGASDRRAGFEVGTFGFFLHMETPTPIGRLAYGLEYYHDNVNSFERRSNVTGSFIQGPVGDDSSYDILGIYLQDTIPLTDRLDVVLGGRYTYAKLDAGRVIGDPNQPVTGPVISLDDEYSAFVASARAIYSIIPDKVNIFGGVSQGFRAPNLSDVSSNRTSGSGVLEIPALGLDPEYYISFELGLKVREQNWGGQVAYFYTIIDDMIIRTPTGQIDGGSGNQIVQATNSGDGFVHGVELEAWWRFHPNFTLFGNVAWVESRVDAFSDLTDPTSGFEDTLTRTMPLTGLIGLRFDSTDRKWWVEGTVQMVDNANMLSLGDMADTQRIPPGGHESYGVASIRGGIRITPDVTLTAAVENITNEDYRVHGSGVNQPGRNFVLGVEIKF